MKKLWLLSALALFSFMGSQAQIQFGVKAGVNISRVSYNYSGSDDFYFGVNYGTKVGFFAGALIDIPVSEKFHAQPEILFSSEGGKFGSENVPYNYINVPLLVKYIIIDRLSAHAGPQVGYLLSVDGESDLEGVNRIPISFDLGGEYEIIDNLVGIARVNLGITNLSKDNDEKVRQTTFQIGVGYKF